MFIDMMVDGSFLSGTDPESLVGSTFEVEQLITTDAVAVGVKKLSIPK